MKTLHLKPQDILPLGETSNVFTITAVNLQAAAEQAKRLGYKAAQINFKTMCVIVMTAEATEGEPLRTPEHYVARTDIQARTALYGRHPADTARP